jgi:signal transduction histidine kinase
MAKVYKKEKIKSIYHPSLSKIKLKSGDEVSELTDNEKFVQIENELAFQNEEKEKRAAELIIANKELVFQNAEKEKRAAELIVANKELAFQNEEKEKRADELIIANKELAFQNEEKEKRAAELIVANEELAFQSLEKEKRAAELIVANKELIFQNIEKEKRAEEFKKLNQELEQKVIERTSQLEAANKELEAFSYSVSHDLRAPLRGIDGFANILLEDYSEKLDEEAQRLLNIIRENTQKMGHLIDDLLAFSRISKHELDKSEIDVKTLANSIYYELTSDQDRKRISFSVADLPRLNGEASMIRQLMYNLISNAIKFSSKKENPKIEIGFKHEKGNNIYFIGDNGVGFDMKYYGKLFGVFQRLHNEAEFKGTGVGLAIAKRIVNKHGGKIWAESEINIGTTIYFTI